MYKTFAVHFYIRPQIKVTREFAYLFQNHTDRCNRCDAVGTIYLYASINVMIELPYWFNEKLLLWHSHHEQKVTELTWYFHVTPLSKLRLSIARDTNTPIRHFISIHDFVTSVASSLFRTIHPLLDSFDTVARKLL